MAGYQDAPSSYDEYKVTGRFTGCVADTSNKLTGTVNGAAMAAGDFNNDGWLDVIYFRSKNRNRIGNLTQAYFIKNLGSLTSNDVPTFGAVEIPDSSSIFSAELAWHLTADVVDVIDWDKDGRDDLLFASSTSSGVRVILFRQNPTQTADSDLFTTRSFN